MIETIRLGLAKSHNSKLVDELLNAYVEAKRNFYLGGLRLSEVEGPLHSLRGSFSHLRGGHFGNLRTPLARN